MERAYQAGMRHVDHFWCAMSSVASLRSRYGTPMQASMEQFVLAHPDPQAAALSLLASARGLRVFDPNLRQGLWGSARRAELVHPFVERCDLLLGGKSELAELVGEGDARTLAQRCAVNPCARA